MFEYEDDMIDIDSESQSKQSQKYALILKTLAALST